MLLLQYASIIRLSYAGLRVSLDRATSSMQLIFNAAIVKLLLTECLVLYVTH
jgi:hypothetical protein